MSEIIPRHFFRVSALARLYMRAPNPAIRRLLGGLIVSLSCEHSSSATTRDASTRTLSSGLVLPPNCDLDSASLTSGKQFVLVGAPFRPKTGA